MVGAGKKIEDYLLANDDEQMTNDDDDASKSSVVRVLAYDRILWLPQ